MMAGACGAVDIRQRLSGEYHRRVLLAQRFQPFAELSGKAYVVEREPTFVDDQQCRTTVEPPLDAMKEIGQHCRRGTCADQTFGFKGLDFGLSETLGLGIEQPAIGSAEAIGLQRTLERLRLQQHRQTGQRTFGCRC